MEPDAVKQALMAAPSVMSIAKFASGRYSTRARRTFDSYVKVCEARINRRKRGGGCLEEEE